MLMLHTKFRGNRSTGSGEEGFLRVTFTIILMNFLFHVPKKLTYSPRCYMPSFVKIGPPAPEKIFEGFLLAAILVM